MSSIRWSAVSWVLMLTVILCQAVGPVDSRGIDTSPHVEGSTYHTTDIGPPTQDPEDTPQVTVDDDDTNALSNDAEPQQEKTKELPKGDNLPVDTLNGSFNKSIQNQDQSPDNLDSIEKKQEEANNVVVKEQELHMKHLNVSFSKNTGSQGQNPDNVKSEHSQKPTSTGEGNFSTSAGAHPMRRQKNDSSERRAKREEYYYEEYVETDVGEGCADDDPDCAEYEDEIDDGNVD